jgi:hypothetical protein
VFTKSEDREKEWRGIIERENGEGEWRGRIERESSCYRAASGGDHGVVDDRRLTALLLLAAATADATALLPLARMSWLLGYIPVV